MTLIEIENLPFAEIKSRRDELIEAAKRGELGELAARYVKTLEIAKLRDEKLGEQGRTINTLNDAAEGAKEDCKKLTAKLSELVNTSTNERERMIALMDDLSAKLKAEIDRLTLANNELAAKLAAETARADRMKAEATRANNALTAAEKALKDAVAERQLEAAERG